ncbi:MAG: hypothetical protein EHJ94_07650 [Deltaproteobacteria bacterium]|nr:MAG: hypothetical protein EHJ94_07650 [Deltaproteobacteria bacterium]
MIITRMTLEKKSGNILLTLNAGNLNLCAKVIRSNSAAIRFQPGESVWLLYNPKDAKWISKER